MKTNFPHSPELHVESKLQAPSLRSRKETMKLSTRAVFRLHPSFHHQMVTKGITLHTAAQAGNFNSHDHHHKHAYKAG